LHDGKGRTTAIIPTPEVPANVRDLQSMDHQTAATGFGFGMDFSNVDFSATDFTKTSEGNTQTPFIFGDESFGDEGIDTTTCASFDQSFGSMNTPMYSLPLTDSAFSMQQNLVRPPR
jgi:hypothetical protein